MFEVNTFTVQVATNVGETVCVVGNCAELGNWYSKDAVTMERATDNSSCDVWRVSVPLPKDVIIEYRYFVCVKLEWKEENRREIIVRRWETNRIPRKILPGRFSPEFEDFGRIDDTIRIENGWLTAESVVQLKFYNNPFQIWKRRFANRLFYVKVTPVDLQRRNSIADAPMEEDSTSDIMDGLRTSTTCWPIVEVAVMNPQECEFRMQEQFGRVYQPDEFVIYKAQMLHPETIAFMVDFYLDENIPLHVGFCYILPSVLRNTCGTSLVPITGLKQQPIGQLTVEYLVIRPMHLYECDMKVSYAKYWKRGRRALDVGHRGAGNSYHSSLKHCANVRENTIASLKLAANHGADYVEFDIHLSKDLVPVLYHDFHVCISMKKKKFPSEHDLLEIPVKDLTLQQLQMLKLYHVSEKLKEGSIRLEDDGSEDTEPFPTLQQTLEQVEHHVGFNIEIKWTMQRKDGTFELENPFEINLYLDTVLKVLLKHAADRRIIISSFHPDICTMVRLKQNKYPVLFLTQGQTDKWPPYLDTRTCSIPMAIYFARSAGILGIDVHTEDLLKESEYVKKSKEAGLVIFCWGDDNNDPYILNHLRELGLDGIIYDRINDHHNCEKENIFLMESKARKGILETAGIVNDSSFTFFASEPSRSEASMSMDGTVRSLQET